LPSPPRGAGQRIVEANLHDVGGARAQDEGTSDPREADRETRLEKGATGIPTADLLIDMKSSRAKI
jgi:hypothetical protein